MQFYFSFYTIIFYISLELHLLSRSCAMSLPRGYLFIDSLKGPVFDILFSGVYVEISRIYITGLCRLPENEC